MYISNPLKSKLLVGGLGVDGACLRGLNPDSGALRLCIGDLRIRRTKTLDFRGFDSSKILI